MYVASIPCLHAVTVLILLCSPSPPSHPPSPLPLPQALGETSTAISPKALSLLVSHLLYFKFRGSGTAPIVAGLDHDGTPVLCTQGEGKEEGRMKNAGGAGRKGRRGRMDDLTNKQMYAKTDVTYLPLSHVCTSFTHSSSSFPTQTPWEHTLSKTILWLWAPRPSPC